MLSLVTANQDSPEPVDAYSALGAPFLERAMRANNLLTRIQALDPEHLGNALALQPSLYVGIMQALDVMTEGSLMILEQAASHTTPPAS